MARDPPGARAICARNLSVPTADTSIRYSRPLIVSSKRCTVTAEAAFCALRYPRASERTREDASTCSTPTKSGPAAHKIFVACQNVHKLSTVHPHVFHRMLSPRRLRVGTDRVDGRGDGAGPRFR